jgi:hypothetical protein
MRTCTDDRYLDAMPASWAEHLPGSARTSAAALRTCGRHAWSRCAYCVRRSPFQQESAGLGRRCESAAKTANLSGFKILAFALNDHVPGELNGLTQLALALSVVTSDNGMAF